MGDSMGLGESVSGGRSTVEGASGAGTCAGGGTGTGGAKFAVGFATFGAAAGVGATGPGSVGRCKLAARSCYMPEGLAAWPHTAPLLIVAKAAQLPQGSGVDSSAGLRPSALVWAPY